MNDLVHDKRKSLRGKPVQGSWTQAKQMFTCSKSTIETLEKGVFIFNFEHN